MSKHRADTNSIVDRIYSRRAVKADAINRSKRTFVQGFAIDITFAVAMALLAWLPDADISSREAWTVFGVALAKTVLTSAASYVMRLKVTPSVEP